MDINFKIKKIITEKNLIEAGDTVLAAVSGGVDSISLAAILAALQSEVGFFLSIIHVNHKLRGAESDEDAKFVENFAGKNSLPYFGIEWKGAKNKENVQDSARNFRYRSFIKRALESGANRVALAHNMDDQAETILLNLIRGAALDGICGMTFTRQLTPEIRVVRPFLETQRIEIEAFAAANSINFRHDASNDETKYNRNFIRHKVMPLIKKINPNAVNSIFEMSQILQNDEEYLKDLVEKNFGEVIKKVDSNSVEIEEEKFRKIEGAVRARLLRNAYKGVNGSLAGITKDHIKRMDDISLGPKKEGNYDLPNGLRFKKKSSKLAIFRK